MFEQHDPSTTEKARSSPLPLPSLPSLGSAARRTVLHPCPPSPHPVQASSPRASSPRSVRSRAQTETCIARCIRRQSAARTCRRCSVHTHARAHACAPACPLLDEASTGQHACSKSRARDKHGRQHGCWCLRAQAFAHICACMFCACLCVCLCSFVHVRRLSKDGHATTEYSSVLQSRRRHATQEGQRGQGHRGRRPGPGHCRCIVDRRCYSWSGASSGRGHGRPRAVCFVGEGQVEHCAHHRVVLRMDSGPRCQ